MKTRWIHPFIELSVAVMGILITLKLYFPKMVLGYQSLPKQNEQFNRSLLEKYTDLNRQIRKQLKKIIGGQNECQFIGI